MQYDRLRKSLKKLRDSLENLQKELDIAASLCYDLAETLIEESDADLSTLRRFSKDRHVLGSSAPGKTTD